MNPEIVPASDIAGPDNEPGAPELPPDLPKDVAVFRGQLYYRGVPVDQMLAYPLSVAKLLLGIERTALWREIQMNRIRMTPLKLIPRKELERYLDEQANAAFTPKQRRRRAARLEASPVSAS